MRRIALALLIGLAGCEINATAPRTSDAPTDFGFQLEPSGDANAPLGVLLFWSPPANGLAVSYDVYGRTGSGDWLLRATTSSTTFDDAGVPQDQYYVVALDENGAEMGRTDALTIDLTDRLPPPTGLTSITLNGAIHLSWDDNALNSSPTTFDYYRVYSSAYSATTDECVEPWAFEGSTVTDAFLAGNLPNGVSRCFAVSAVTLDGHESLWSSARLDTPRLDARSVLVYVNETKPDSAAFIFNDELAHKFGVVGASSRTDADFTLSRQLDGSVLVKPARAGSTARTYSATSVPDLTSIDFAPASGYQSVPLTANPGVGYVFRVTEGDGTHFGAMRVQFVAHDFIVFDWAYQNGVGNPELSIGKASGGH